MLEQITKILRSYKDDQALKVTEETTFDTLGLDSLDVVELVMEFEEEFDVTIELDENIQSVGALMAVISAAS